MMFIESLTFVGSESMQGMQQRCVLGPSVEQRNSR